MSGVISFGVVWEDGDMKITEDQLRSFIKLYQQEFFVLLSKSEARQKATVLLSYVLLGLEPLAKVDEGGINDMPD